MTVNEWLISLLQQQELGNQELNNLKNLAREIEDQLSILPGNPKFYIAGSLAKGTIIRKQYDLDIVMYWPFDPNPTFYLKDIYEAVGDVLKENYKYVNQKTVSWEIPSLKGDFHIDVVPGRALDQNYYEANLYRTDTKTRLKTSLKKHIDTVKKSGRIEVIRLLKLWREVNKVPLKKSFLLEIMAIEGAELALRSNLGKQFYRTLSYIRDNIKDCNFQDPANGNNSLCEDLTSTMRYEIYKKAYEAVKAVDEGYWSRVFLNQF